MSWGLGWKRPSEVFHLSLNYGTDDHVDNNARSSTLPRSLPSSSSSILSQNQELGFCIKLEWSAAEDEDQGALKLQSQLMSALPSPQDWIVIELSPQDAENVSLDMKVVKRREPLRVVRMSKPVGSGQQSDGTGVLIRLLRSNLAPSISSVAEGNAGLGDHWRSVSVLSLNGCGLLVSVLPYLSSRLMLQFHYYVHCKS